VGSVAGSGSVDKTSGIRKEVGLGALGVDTGLEGVADAGNLGLSEGKGVAGGDGKLPGDKVNTSDLLGDGVLDLETSVHLHEEELASDGVHDELDGTGTDVVDGLGGSDRLLGEVLLDRSSEAGGGSLLNDLCRM
jgi:hypothetical protein